MASRYWCHLCEQIVNPILEIEQVEINCPVCQSGFVEEMAASASASAPNLMAMPDFPRTADFADSDRALSLWAPVLLGMMGHPRRRRRFSHLDNNNNDDDDDDDHDGDGDPGEDRNGDLGELDRELDSIIRRRRRSSATILQLLQGIRAGLASESQNLERDRGRERVILVNPSNQALLAQDEDENRNPIGSFGDYFIGPGLDLLLQHLAENDPNRYGTPPARKEAVEALPTVAIEGNLQCPVCLDDFEAGAQAKEMPCNHKFHSSCILPWLDLHSSCPVCRFQLPADESKHDSDALSNENAPREIDNQDNSPPPANGGQDEGDGEEEGGNASGGRRFTFPWPFTGLFSSSGSQSNGENSSSSLNSNANSSGSASSQTNEN